MPTKLELTRASVTSALVDWSNCNAGDQLLLSQTRAPRPSFSIHPVLPRSLSLILSPVPLKPLAGIRNREEGINNFTFEQRIRYTLEIFRERKRILTIDRVNDYGDKGVLDFFQKPLDSRVKITFWYIGSRAILLTRIPAAIIKKERKRGDAYQFFRRFP